MDGVRGKYVVFDASAKLWEVLTLIKQHPHPFDVLAQLDMVEPVENGEVNLVGDGRFIQLGGDFANYE